MVMREAIARQKHNQVTEERDLVLLDSKSDISLSGIQLAPAKELLRIDLELIAAMQESLKDSKFAKHMEHKNRKFDAVQLYKELGDEARQVKYWTDQLAGSGYNQNLTAETKSAMMLNLTNIARTFETGFKTGKVSKDLDRDLKSATAQFLKDFPELEQEVSLTGRNDFDAIDQINMLKSSNIELKRLAGANAPERRYTKDFALSEKAKLATAEDAADTSALSI
ncbi:MAG: hypothetical protein LQ346_007751 [Caloplaca aetnensis]|nr:MAG: hypothetical protein LQ346_007751 [Caloplaca aetnensis]